MLCWREVLKSTTLWSLRITSFSFDSDHTKMLCSMDPTLYSFRPSYIWLFSAPFWWSWSIQMLLIFIHPKVTFKCSDNGQPSFLWSFWRKFWASLKVLEQDGCPASPSHAHPSGLLIDAITVATTANTVITVDVATSVIAAFTNWQVHSGPCFH